MSAKILKTVSLPPEVIEALCEVSQMIARNDEDTLLPCDDSIQIDPICGGLSNDGSGRFEFTVYPPSAIPYKWFIALSQDEIRNISTGTRSTLELWCCENTECGFKTNIENDVCPWCDHDRPRVENQIAVELTPEQKESSTQFIEQLHQWETDLFNEMIRVNPGRFHLNRPTQDVEQIVDGRTPNPSQPPH